MTKEEIKLIPKCPGIYRIINTINNKSYIGQSINLKRRLLQHYNLWNNSRIKKCLYSAFLKYGIENFKIEILEYITEEINEELYNQLDILEIFYIKKYNTYGENGYNETKGGEKHLGCNHSKRIAQKISNSLKEYYKTHKWLLSENKYTYGYNYKEKYFIEAISRTLLSKQLKERGFNISPTKICNCAVGNINYYLNFVFGNSKEECIEKLKWFNSEKAKYSSALAPNYEQYLEYLKTIVDKNGYLPKISEIAKHYNRAETTICGWNKHISEYIKLDKSHNRLMLIGFSNENIEYDINEYNKKQSERWANKYSIYIISENKTIYVSSEEGGNYFNITSRSFRRLTSREVPYRENFIIKKL